MRAAKRWRFGAAGAALALACAAATAGEVERPAPEVDVRLLNGKLLKARDLRGQVVVKMVWATWSPAARTELPGVQKLYREHRAQGLEVIALAIDENVAEVRDFWRARSYSMPVGMRSDAFFDQYGRVSTTPMYYVVDRHGVLRHRLAGPVGAEKLEALVRPLLDAAPPQRVATR